MSRCAERQSIALPQRSTFVSPERAAQLRGSRAENHWHIDPSGDAKIGATTAPRALLRHIEM